MSDGGRGRASLAVEVWKSSQNVGVRRSAVRSIAWLDRSRGDDPELKANERGQSDDDEQKQNVVSANNCA